MTKENHQYMINRKNSRLSVTPRLFNTFLFALLAIGFSLSLQAQSPKEERQYRKEERQGMKTNDYRSQPWQNKLFFEGNGNFNIFNGGTFISFAPVIGYRLTGRSSVGVGPAFAFISQGGASSNAFGGRIFGRYQIIPQLFAHAEYERMSFGDSSNAPRLQTARFPVGGGYSQRIGPRSSFNVMALYDLLYNRNQNQLVIPVGYNDAYIYNGLLLRAGFNVGF